MKQQFPGSGFTAAPPAQAARRHLTACLEGRRLEMQFSQLRFFPHNYCNPCLKLLIRSSSSNEMPDLAAWMKHVSSLLYSKQKNPTQTQPNQRRTINEKPFPSGPDAVCWCNSSSVLQKWRAATAYSSTKFQRENSCLASF